MIVRSKSANYGTEIIRHTQHSTCLSRSEISNNKAMHFEYLFIKICSQHSAYYCNMNKYISGCKYITLKIANSNSKLADIR